MFVPSCPRRFPLLFELMINGNSVGDLHWAICAVGSLPYQMPSLPHKSPQQGQQTVCMKCNRHFRRCVQAYVATCLVGNYDRQKTWSQAFFLFALGSPDDIYSRYHEQESDTLFEMGLKTEDYSFFNINEVVEYTYFGTLTREKGSASCTPPGEPFTAWSGNGIDRALKLKYLECAV